MDGVYTQTEYNRYEPTEHIQVAQQLKVFPHKKKEVLLGWGEFIIDRVAWRSREIVHLVASVCLSPLITSLRYLSVCL